jgi:hypothetical protein
VTFEEMSTARRAVGAAKHRVGVHLRLTLIEGDVPDERQYLHLLIDWNILILLLLDVEETEQRATEGAERREVAGIETVVFGKGSQPGDHLVSGVKDEGVGRSAVAVEEF